MRRPSGTSEMPERVTCSGERPRSDSPASRISPRRASTSPMIACSVVDLPAPLGPISPTISPRADLDREAANGRDAAVADVEAGDLEHRGRHASSSRTALSPR